MDIYFKAIGFSDIQSKGDLKLLLKDIISHPTQKHMSNYGGDIIKVEYFREYSEEFGVLVRGELNDKEELAVYAMIPYKVGKLLTDTQEIEIEKVDEKDIYFGYCEEIKQGTPITFYLQNVVDYLNVEEQEDVYINGVRLVALCSEGSVILPISKSDDDLKDEEEETKWKEDLIEQARSGNEEAMDILEEEAFEMARFINNRLKNEDLLSILEGFFFPEEEREDIYSILGNILAFKKTVNEATHENVYIIQIECMNSKLEVMINEKDLMGIPTRGMRFKGRCWLQGFIDFAKPTK